MSADDPVDVAETAPRDYSLIVPDGWFQLALDPEDRDRSIAALADLQFRGVDNAPHVKEEVMRKLQRQAKDAYGIGGMELYLSTLTLGPMPLASSLLVSMPPADSWPRAATVLQLASHLGESVDADVSVVELAVAGPAVREVRKEAPSPEAQMGNTLPTTTVLYYVQIPATARWLMMTFSTPLDPLAEQMMELFDVVADTLQWKA